MEKPKTEMEKLKLYFEKYKRVVVHCSNCHHEFETASFMEDDLCSWCGSTVYVIYPKSEIKIKPMTKELQDGLTKIDKKMGGKSI